MIGLRDSVTLARTKVRSKRIRLLVTTVVSGLLFGLIGGGVLLLDGTAASVDRFAEQNLGGRYLVQGTPMLSAPEFYPNPTDPTVRAEVEALHTAYVTERTAAAKKYGITDYDPKSEAPPVVDDPYGDPSIPADQRKTVNMESVAWQRYQSASFEKAMRGSSATPEKFAAEARAAGATGTYEPRTLQHLGLTHLKDGREDLTGTTAPGREGEPQPGPGSEVHGSEGQGPESSVVMSNFTLLDDDLVEAFVTEPNAARSTPKGIPILVPVDDVVVTFGKSLGLAKRPKDSEGQIAWYRAVRDRANGVTFTACYRNQAERDRVEEARRTAADVAANTRTPGWKAPELVLALPTKPCGAVTVASDTRSEREKEKEANQRAFESQFSPQEPPRAELLTFQIVGVLPTAQAGSGGLESLVSSVVGTTYGYGSIIPSGLLAELPAAMRHSEVLSREPVASPESMMMYGPMGPEAAFIASFPTVEQAKRFIASYACGGGGGLLGNDYMECNQAFSVGTYGTSYLVVDDIRREARPFLLVVLGVLFGVATIIIWAMMGRVIADSRRETAVFRAIGAKRSDIVKVYLLYSLWVALRIALFAGVLAAGIVLAVEALYSRRATNAAQLAYGVFDGDATFHFLGTPSPLFWAILGGILAMALVAITPPLLRNIRRNPIRDMRDE